MDYKRIKNADLNYPIFTIPGPRGPIIVDGYHRYAKAFLEGHKSIKTYAFDKKLIKKFIIGKAGDWKAVDDISLNDFLQMFFKKFCVLHK